MPDDNLPVNTTSHGPEDSERTLSLMGGVAQSEGEGGDEFDVFSSEGGGIKFLSQGTMLIVLVLIIATATLAGMRFSQSDISEGGPGAEVEKTIDTFLEQARSKKGAGSNTINPKNIDDLFKDVDDLVERFVSDVTHHQVPVTLVKKNPFMLPQYRSTEPEKPKEVVVKVDPRIEIRKRLDKEYSQLQLQSIMQGARPVAIINGEFLRPGQTLGSFTIESISGFAVELTAEGETYTLEMETPK